jgi:4a-hydroxytetrahydrobiopterin dehydratase
LEDEVELNNRKCSSCKNGRVPLKGDALDSLLQNLEAGWNVVEERMLEKEYLFPDFQTGLDFTNEVGKLAEAECHHPDLYLSYGKVKVQLWTHKIDGLSENDFILASKCDVIKNGMK